jgi:hypothetical protein
MVLLSDKEASPSFKTDGEIALSIQQVSVSTQSAGDQSKTAGAKRVIGNTDVDNGGTYDYDQLAFTLGIRLGNRVRLASGDADATRRRTIYMPDHHLWLIHPGTVIGLDGDTLASDFAAPIAPADVVVVRDDRPALAIFHALAWEWYGSDHRTATWQIRECCLISQTEAAAESSTAGVRFVDNPKLGNIITELKHNGMATNNEALDLTLNTMVTSIRYDAVSGVSTITTDWQELDF